MSNSGDFDATFEVFETIRREMITIIAHCSFHRSILQDIVLRNAEKSPEPIQTLEKWEKQSLSSIERLRFSDLNKRDKALANAVYEEAARTAETFWRVLMSQAKQHPAPARDSSSAATSDPGYDSYDEPDSQTHPHSGVS
jgi:hypothetical protein